MLEDTKKNTNTETTPVLIDAAEVVVPCTNFAALFAFFTIKLGFKVSLIFPADAPSTAVIAGHGLTLRLTQVEAALLQPPLTLRLQCESLNAVAGVQIPEGIHVVFVPKRQVSAITVPASVPSGVPEFVLSRAEDSGAHKTVGRAGMIYRDLIPGRLGGRLVASHITIPEGGEVPDYVHFHRIIFQLIYCKAGWVKVVYEGQGAPFLLHAGDCVLQPPEMRHRVLEASAGLEVIELGCPAVHETFADAYLALPTPLIETGRRFGGQQFVRHIALEAQWEKWRENGKVVRGIEAADTGISGATQRLAAVHILRLELGFSEAEFHASHEGEILFFYVLSGAVKLTLKAATTGKITQHTLAADDSVVIPAGDMFTVHAMAGRDDFSMLRVAL